ncbi:hypothetical protein M0805_002877 [Coniferiporia weirii]|nr:hypothetical protein M0805_002877 [Coniferiporia weirii]
MVPPKSQGLHSSTFVQPPLDFTLSFPALFDWQAEHSREHPIFIFEDAPGISRTIHWGEAVQGIHRAAQFVRRAVGRSLKTGSGEKPLIAVLASSDTITFYSFVIGVMRTGWTIFPISPRNSPAAVVTLLEQTKASHLFVSVESAIQSLADASLDQIRTKVAIVKHRMPVFEDLFPIGGYDHSFQFEPPVDVDMDSYAIILHSSGSTAFPKPIYITHRVMITNASFPCYGETDLCGRIFACHSVPMFHGAGMFIVVYSIASGFIVAVFKPQSPAMIPNVKNVIEGTIAMKSDYIFVTPTFLESWSRDSNYVRALAKMKGVVYAGGPLSKEAGDYFAGKGVNIFVLLASTQVMSTNTFLQKPAGMDWEYFQISPLREAHFIDHGNNEYELVIIATEQFRPNVINTMVNGREAYETSDLLSPHPTKKGYWKVASRTDDQIMHSTGEKTNPGPLESMLCQDSLVHGAIMFGRGRFHCGVLVQPKDSFTFDPSDVKKLVEFRNFIWPTIEKINAYAPTHSRIFKEMLIVTSPSKPLLYTPKGTIRRVPTLDQYTEEINAVYAAVDESAQDEVEGPVDWWLPNVTEFVRQVVRNTMRKGNNEFSDNADLFEFGLDSLQATWIRNTFLRVLRETHSSIARGLSMTYIYDNPTISGLSKYLFAKVTGISAAPIEGGDDKRRELYALLSKYSSAFPDFEPVTSNHYIERGGDVVLITGSTGSLGSNIMARLIQSVGIARVYALSRPSSDGTTARERHARTFEREGLDVKLLDSLKVRFLQGDPSSVGFAIGAEQYEEMQSTVTHIIHNGWRVDFSVALTSFESNIRSVRNFIDFALGGRGAAPARIIFISSVGVFLNYKEKVSVAEEPLEQPDCALGMGYAESKWVSEQILEKASTMTPLSTTIVRCGQMTGGPSGTWNSHEWFPSLMKSSVSLGKAPNVNGTVSWISAYEAADAIVDFLHADAERVLHLVHPHPVPWSGIISAFARSYDLRVVPYDEWVAALEGVHADLYADIPDTRKVESAHRANPALRLLDFFRAAQDRDEDTIFEPMGIPKLRCEKALAASDTLKNAECVGEENVRRWIASWDKAGFIRK